MISVVMPVYNSEKYLKRAIESILQQTYKDIELIIVDDGSTDRSSVIINEYAQIDHRVRVISQKNSGVSAARNAGMNIARGEWLYFIDSDDYVDLDFFQDAMHVCRYSDFIIVGVQKHYVNSNKKDNTIRPENIKISTPKEYVDFLDIVIKDKSQDLYFNYIWNKIIRTSIVVDRKARFNENLSLGEDFLFNCDLLEYPIRITTICKAYYHYNIHGGASLVNRFYENELERRKIIYQRMKDLYSSYSLYYQNKNELEIREGRFSYYSLSKIYNKSCNLTIHNKVEYIKTFLKERKRSISMYLSKEGGIKNHIKRIVITIGNARLVYLMFVVLLIKQTYKKK